MKIFFPLLLSLLFGKSLEECAPQQQTSFAVVTGYVLNSSDGKLLIRTIPEINSLAECLTLCLEESACRSANFKIGLCMLFTDKPVSPPEGLLKSQYPIFSMFGWKICIPKGTCSRAWSAEVFQSKILKSASLPVSNHSSNSLEECYQQCLSETEFNCRSANYYKNSGQCLLNKFDRFTESSITVMLEENPNIDYIESNCDMSSRSVCNFIEKKGFIIGTADSVLSPVKTSKECNTLCVKEKQFQCRTFDFNETGPGECRLSHHSSQSLQQFEMAYLEVKGSVTHHLSSCYNVTIDCKAEEMIARVETNKPFSGKIYAKDQPESCVQDVSSSTNFELRLGYNEVECNVQQTEPGKFSTNLIIQHHDQIITGLDVEMNICCSFNVHNSSIKSGVKIFVNGDPEAIANGEASFAISPTVAMQITDRKGHDIHTAKVGDALSLRFHILDKDTSYEIFVRELVAMDGVDSSEILLIDSTGCPTDPTIMGPITTVLKPKTPKILEAPFDAFKFPTSDVVQFKALVTPCLPTCEPVNCTLEDYYGIVQKVDSYGRRKRHLHSKEEVVVQAIRIEDKFKFNTILLSRDDSTDAKDKFEETEESCLNIADIVMGSLAFIVTQFLIVMVAIVLRRNNKFTSIQKTKYFDNASPTILPQFYRLS